ncbi:MAG: SUMF1/EgtB/PvdO family nonheme iron enzyme [Nitrospinae bacterium]|nr:SUMF1/EgtB/PvdO family nonheme iron enzyme [Nitrospinota bacterium]
MKGLFPAILVLNLACFPSIPAHASDAVEVPAGPFVMGDDADPDAAPRRELTLERFYIDSDETSNAEFAARFPRHAYPAGLDFHPATGMTWDEAREYCEQTGKRLPTEAEWEKAARGTDGGIYPWGNQAPKNPPHPYFSGLVTRRVGFQKYDVSPYGARGMAGSVWEWTADANRDGKKIARGGLWNLHLDYEHARAFEKIFAVPDRRFPFMGFRCARSD